MTIWLQNAASIQKRTSPLKFDQFRSNIPDFIDRIFQQSTVQQDPRSADPDRGEQFPYARPAQSPGGDERVGSGRGDVQGNHVRDVRHGRAGGEDCRGRVQRRREEEWKLREQAVADEVRRDMARASHEERRV